MKRILASLAVLSLAVVFTLGCGKAPSDGPSLSAPAVMTTVYESATLCGDCGQVKGSESCCAEDATACAECELHKDAPGCCKIKPGADVVLCAACGEVEDGESCCAEGAENCVECGLHKDAPGCCTLKELAAEEDAASAEGEES